MSILYKYRYVSFAFLIVCAVFLGPHIREAMVPNNSLGIWFCRDDPNLRAYEQSLEQFGNDEVIVIYYETPEDDILSKENLSRINGLTQDIGEVENIHRVFSLTNLKDIKFENGQVHTAYLVPENLELSDDQKRIIKSKLMDDPVFGRAYISGNNKGVLITAQLAAKDDIDKMRDSINDSVVDILENRLEMNGIEYYIGGVGILYTFLNKLTTEDASIYVGISYSIMFVLIAILLRSFWGLVITIVVIALTSMITLGLFGATGHQINLMTVALPTLIAILAIVDCIHVLSHHRSGINDDGNSSKGNILKNLSYIIVPCFLTSLTTFVGFLSLFVSKMQILVELGVFSALGVAVAFIVSFITIPVFLGFGKIDLMKANRSRLDQAIHGLTVLCGKTAVKHPYRVIAVFALFSILFLSSIPFVNVDIQTFKYFPDDTKIVRDNDYIINNYGYYFPIEFTLKTKNANGVLDPSFIRKIKQFQDAVENEEDIGRSFSLADVVLKTQKILMEDETAVPNDSDQVSRILQLTAMGDNEALVAYINDKRDYTHLFFYMNFESGKQARALIERILETGEAYFKAEAEISAVGYWPLYLKLVNYALDTQIKGFSLSFGIIFLIIFILFRSVRFTLLAIPPNLFPVFIIGFVLALTGIDLDFGTASISAILLGIVVDDTIHLVYRINKNLKAYKFHPDTAIIMAVSESGQAILMTTVVLVVGFGILMLASVKTVAYFGGLLAIALSMALIADLLLLPALYFAFARNRS